MRAIHGYLFFRIPLVRPARFLEATMPFVAPLYTRTTFVIVITATILGIYLASRQWEAFTNTFLSLLSFEGALLYALALAFIKTLHELGHAYTATRYGIRVNTMGVAFMVLMPLLYTDVSDAWRLTSRRRKLMIDAAGLTVELCVAGVATFLWVFLADGPLRSTVFIIATTSWILSLFVNINPFMRFDGYYLLSDATGIPNLQPRAFALTKWQVREWLFALRAPPPEQFKRRTHRWMIAYAFATWVYRLFLFIGIALIVYHLFFKVLGVTLFVVEIAWFIALPVGRELVEWWKLRDEIMKTRRTLISLTITAGLIALAIIPWSGMVIVPAVTWGETETRLFPAHTARLERLLITDGQRVTKGQTLAVFRSDELDHKHRQTARRITLLRTRLNRIAGDTRELSQREILLTQLEAAKQKRAGHNAERRRLTLVAPITGNIRDLATDLHPGRHLKASEPIATLVKDPGIKARGYISEEDLWRVAPGTVGRFIPDDPNLPASTAVVKELAQSGATTIDIPALASVYGGPVASETSPTNTIKPRAGHYPVRFTLQSKLNNRRVRGVIHLKGKPESFASAAWRRILKVLVRESGV